MEQREREREISSRMSRGPSPEEWSWRKNRQEVWSWPSVSPLPSYFLPSLVRLYNWPALTYLLSFSFSKSRYHTNLLYVQPLSLWALLMLRNTKSHDCAVTPWDFFLKWGRQNVCVCIFLWTFSTRWPGAWRRDSRERWQVITHSWGLLSYPLSPVPFCSCFYKRSELTASIT